MGDTGKKKGSVPSSVVQKKMLYCVSVCKVDVVFFVCLIFLDQGTSIQAHHKSFHCCEFVEVVFI